MDFKAQTVHFKLCSSLLQYISTNNFAGTEFKIHLYYIGVLQQQKSNLNVCRSCLNWTSMFVRNLQIAPTKTYATYIRWCMLILLKSDYTLLSSINSVTCFAIVFTVSKDWCAINIIYVIIKYYYIRHICIRHLFTLL